MVVPKCTAMLHFLAAFRGLRLALLSVWRDPETKALPLIVGVLLVSGTTFYWAAEDWSLIQSLYFSVVTLTTVGYGDITPATELAKRLVVVGAFVGQVFLITFVARLVSLWTGRFRR